MERKISTIDLLSQSEMRFSHKMLLEKPYRITCISQTIQDLLGFTEDEIGSIYDNLYVEMVYVEDREKYLAFASSLSEKEQTLTLTYRMVKKTGEVIYVNDTSFSHKKNDERMYSFTMLADISECIAGSVKESNLLAIPSSAAPFGYLQCTCEKFPKVLYINDQLLSRLKSPDDDDDFQEFLQENIFFMIPFEDRDQFKMYLEQALGCKEPIKIHHRLIECCGKHKEVTGYLGTITNIHGIKEYSIIYTDMDGTDAKDSSVLDNSYFRALESAYNIIFEINVSLNTVECIYGKDTSALGKLYDVRMTMESAASFWLNNYIVEEDRPAMQEFFNMLLQKGTYGINDHPLQTEFSIMWDDNKIYTFIGVVIQLDKSSVLFCCRDTAKVQFSSIQAKEIQAFRRFHAFVDEYLPKRRNLIGALIINEQEDGTLMPIYASETVLRYFNLRSDQYLHYLSVGFSKEEIITFAERHGIIGFEDLLSGAISKLTINNNDNKYSLTYSNIFLNTNALMVSGDGTPAVIAGIPQRGIFARTFGYFDLFIDGEPVVFSNNKEKELLALLIDRNGGTLSSSEALAYLWEDELPDEKLKTRFRKLAMGLKRTLQQYGIEKLLINHNGVRSVDTSLFTCDYYELISGNTQYVQSFHNTYMTDYSWGERTLGTLWDYT